MSLATPEKIRSLQRKLYLKAKAEPAFRFYLLHDKICREDILRHAYDLARANKGAPGVDGVIFAMIEAEELGLPARRGLAAEHPRRPTYPHEFASDTRFDARAQRLAHIRGFERRECGSLSFTRFGTGRRRRVPPRRHERRRDRMPRPTLRREHERP